MKDPVILEKLARMAKRLDLTSNQMVLVYAGANNWLNFEHATIAVNILEKIAMEAGIGLYEQEPFLMQLIEKRAILPEEAELFGWRVQKTEVQDGAKKMVDRIPGDGAGDATIGGNSESVTGSSNSGKDREGISRRTGTGRRKGRPKQAHNGTRAADAQKSPPARH
ncbi:MAG: hypothetical protein ACE5JO_04615 [Candidatus Binatia bacterium]